MKDSAPIGTNPGDEKAFRVAYLVAGFLRHTLTEAEHTELDDWVTANMDNQRLFEKLIDEKNIDQAMRQKNQLDIDADLASTKSSITFPAGKRKSVTGLIWYYVTAACILIGLLIAFLVFPGKKPKQPSMVQLSPADIAPGSNRAILTLSDGTAVRLDSARNGRLVTQGEVTVTKLDSGQLAYRQDYPVVTEKAIQYNTLSTPAGGQYKIVLPDGTKVWLNASSSLKYPTAFAGVKRLVELTGEGYFEVAKDPMFPFEVTANGSTIQVLGTHFNINAYADEPLLKVTLAEGSIKLNNSATLQPGEEASVNNNGNIRKKRADLESVLAWKNGQFVFKETQLDVLMRQVSRWYNAGIIYDINVKKHFNATIKRDVPVSRLLHLLEGTGEVHFKIDNNKITVMK